MTQMVSFERAHNIDIEAPAAAVLDYVSNPNSWSEWLAATHGMDSPDRPLDVGDRFSEQWQTRHGPAQLNWIVTERNHPVLWTGETYAEFIGTIVVTYSLVETGENKCNFTRIMRNPARIKAPTEGAINRMDEEAKIALANIKKYVEAAL
jgi:Polyketide cyclase / dehydrase and lipid transport